MRPPIETMVDMIGANVSKVPAIFPYVGAYVSGLEDVPWTLQDILKYSNAKVSRIYQGAGTYPGIHGFDEIDVEDKAVTPQQAANLVKLRVEAGIQWTTIYATDSNLAIVSQLIRDMGESVWNGHVNCRLADWSLDEANAAMKVGTFIHGMSCIGVQWASPSSNPLTQLPGTGMTLKQAGVDLSVVDANWTPSGGFTPTGPNPPQPPAIQLSAVAVIMPTGATRRISSGDNGTTWR